MTNEMQRLSHEKNWIGEDDHNMIFWLGDHMAGQVFYTQKKLISTSISLFPEIVPDNCVLKLTVHSFDQQNKRWSAPVAESEVSANKDDEEQWLKFSFPALTFQQGQWYGFKVQSSKGRVAIAEGIHVNALSNSLEWISKLPDIGGHFHKDFHLAYRIQVAA